MMMTSGYPKTQNTRLINVLTVSSPVVPTTGMYRVKRVSAHTTTKMLVKPPDRRRGPLWSRWITSKGSEGVGTGTTGAFARVRDRRGPQTWHALVNVKQSCFMRGQ